MKNGIPQMPRRFPVLRPFYYLDHFEEMIAFLEADLPSLIGALRRELIRLFRLLPKEARALLVRMTNRKGSVFRIDGLNYRELTNLNASLEVLLENSFIRRPGEADLPSLIGALRRDEIVPLLINPAKYS